MPRTEIDMDQPSHHLKVYLHKPGNVSEIRRFEVPFSIDYEELVQTLQQRFMLETTEGLSIQYKDNESDLCTISSDLELNEAFVAKKDADVLRLELVTDHKENTSPFDPIHNKSSNSSFDEFWSDSEEIRDAITSAYQHFVEAISPLIVNAEKIQASLPSPKAMLEILKPTFESFMNDPSASVKKPFQAFVNNLDAWLAEIDLWAHQKSQGATPERSDQPNAESFIDPYKVFYEKILNEAKSFFNDLEEWLTQFAQKSEPEEDTARESTPESSDQPFVDSFIRPFKDLYGKVTSEPVVESEPVVVESEPVVVESDTTKSEVEEPPLFEQQMGVLKRMGFLDDSQNLAILMQKNGDLSSAVLMLLDSY
jgi:hypothetical protein